MNPSLSNVKKVTIASLLVAVAVVGSTFSFPVGISKCAPIQHMVNILCAVFLGRYAGVSVAFCASSLRLLLGLGSILAYPGSMWGALLAGIVYHRTGSLILTLIAEVFGTGILGGLTAYPLAILVLGKTAGQIAFYTYVVPFLISTIGGSLLAGILLFTLRRTGALRNLQQHTL